jgi:tetratricopeptide (TPR) repeat protein
VRDPVEAIELATKAVELAPDNWMYLNTLGVAQYRGGHWLPAIESLDKSVAQCPQEMFAHSGFFLAMAHWQLDQRDQAREYYHQALESMERYRPDDAELNRFRVEAAELLGIAEEPAPHQPDEAQTRQ